MRVQEALDKTLLPRSGLMGRNSSFTPAAFTLTKTPPDWVGPGSGVSSIFRTSGLPNSLTQIAFIEKSCFHRETYTCEPLRPVLFPRRIQTALEQPRRRCERASLYLQRPLRKAP